MSMTSKVYKVSDEEFAKIVRESPSCAAAMKALGYKTTTGNSFTIMQRRIKELNLDISHWGNINQQAMKAIITPIEQYFALGVKHGGANMRRRILREGLLEYKCAICGFEGDWNGKPLVLQIDHINGNHFDNRLENLRFVCPNCHTQTETFAGRNVGRSNKE